MDVSGRAADLLDRLEALGMEGGLTDEDLIGIQAREPLRTACGQLADALAAVSFVVPLGDDPKQVAAACARLASACSTAQGSNMGHLDAALGQAARAVDEHSSASGRVECLETLVAALQAARMLASRQALANTTAAKAATAPSTAPHAPATAPTTAAATPSAGPGPADAMEVDDSAVVAASQQLQGLAKLLGLDGERSKALPLLRELIGKLQELLGQLPPGFFEPMLARDALDGAQMQMLEEVHGELAAEYTVRRSMLLERAKVTLQSFTWSNRLIERGTYAEVQMLVARQLASMSPQPAVALEDVFAARPGDVASVSRKATSGEGHGKFVASVKSVLIGKVPDRGGRTEGRNATMPEWTERRASADGGGGRGRGGRGRAGGGGRGAAGGGRGQGQGQAGKRNGSGGGAGGQHKRAQKGSGSGGKQ